MSHAKLKELAEKRDAALKAAGEARAKLTSEDEAVRAQAAEAFDKAWGDFEKYEKEHDELKRQMDADANRSTRYDEAAERMSRPNLRESNIYSASELEDDDQRYSRAFWDSIMLGRDTPAETREVLAAGQVSHRALLIERLNEQGINTRALLSQSGDGTNVVPSTLLDAIIVYAAPSMPYNGLGGEATPASFYITPGAGPFEVPHVDDNANTCLLYTSPSPRDS